MHYRGGGTAGWRCSYTSVTSEGYSGIIIIRRESTPGDWAKAQENKGKVGIIQYALWYNSPMSYDNCITPLGVCLPFIQEAL